MAKEIKFNVKLLVDGKEQLATATANVNDMRGAMGKAQLSANRLRNSLININQRIEFAKNIAEEVKKMSSAIDAATLKITGWQQGFVSAARVTGLAGDELAAVRGKAQALADTFGGDLSETIRSANALAKGFGVSFDEALRLMQDGFVSGADAQGEFLDTLREYPRYFKEAGISAEEFVAIATNAAKQGIYSDKGVDTIKEGNLRIREMTTATAAALEGIGISATDVQAQLQAGTLTTFQVMQQVAAKLKELPASASAVGTAIADIFGGPGEDAGLEYIKSLADIELSMDAVREGADEYSKALGRQADAQAGMNTMLAGAQEALVALNAKYGTLLQGVSGILSVTANAVISFTAITSVLQKSAVATKALSIAAAEWNRVGKLVRAVNIALGASGHTAAAGAIALKIALRGLLIATGVGAAIWAATAAIEALANAMDGTEDAGSKAADCLTSAERAARQTAETFKSKLGAEASALQSKYAQLQAAWKSLKTEHEKTAWIKANGAEFSALGLKVSDVKSAEDVFVNNTAAVVAALNKRAEAAAHAAMVEDLYKKKLELQDRIQGRNDAATQLHEKRTYKAGQVVSGDDPIFKVIKGVIGREVERVNVNGNRNNFRLTAEAAKKGNDFFTGKNYVNTGAAQKADTAELEQITKSIDKHLQAQVASEKSAAAGLKGGGGAGGNSGSKEFRDFNASNDLKEIAGARSEKDIKSNIAYYEQMRSEVEGNAEAYAEWTQKILDAQDALEQVQSAGKKVELMRDLKKQVAEAAGKNDFSDLNEDKGFKDSSNDLKDFSETANEAADRLRPFREEIEGLQALTAKGLSLEVRDMGVSALTDRIRELKKLLEDTSIPDSQREDIEGMIESYTEYRKEAARSMESVAECWSGVKGIGDGIQSMTDALSGNQDAWSAVCTVVDSAIQIYEGVQAIVAIVEALSAVSKAHAAAKAVESGAVVAETSAEAAGAAAATGTIAANTAKVASNKAAAASAMQLAASEYAAAHAAIPFAGAALAAGFTAASVASAIAAGASIMASPFATGGIVGGSSTSGDKVLARVNSGEMILNRSQQKRLFDLLDGALSASSFAQGAGGGYTGSGISLDVDGLRSSLYGAGAQRQKVEFKMRGKSLVGVMANQTRVAAKSGRRTEIVI